MSDTGAHSVRFMETDAELKARLGATATRLEQELVRTPLFVCIPPSVNFMALAKDMSAHLDSKPAVFGHMVEIEVDAPDGAIFRAILKLVKLTEEHKFAPTGTQRVLFQAICNYDAPRKVICLTLQCFMSAENE